MDLQVFYDPEHPYNIARMIEATKAGLDYFTEQFGPYQFRQFRILEFPRYRASPSHSPTRSRIRRARLHRARPPPTRDLDYAVLRDLHELAHNGGATR